MLIQATRFILDFFLRLKNADLETRSVVSAPPGGCYNHCMLQKIKSDDLMR